MSPISATGSCWSLPLPARFEQNSSEFGYHLLELGTGGGFASWPDERRIKGSVYADKSEPNAMEMLEEARRAIAESEHIDFHDVGEIAEADET